MAVLSPEVLESFQASVVESKLICVISEYQYSISELVMLEIEVY